MQTKKYPLTYIQVYASVTIRTLLPALLIEKIRNERGTRSMKMTPGCNFFSLMNQVNSKHNMRNSLQFNF